MKKTTLLYSIIACLCFTCMIFKAEAQWTYYTSSNSALYSDILNCMAIDHSGVKWFGDGNSIVPNAAGVIRFDGTTWSHYTMSNGVISNTITCIAVDNLNNKWVGTASGASKFDGTTWTSYAYQLSANQVNSIAVDQQNNIWFATTYGVTKYDGTNWTIYRTTDGLINNNVLCVAVDVLNNKWFGTSAGVSKFTGTTWTSYTTSNGLVNNNVTSIAVNPSNNIWFGTSNGVSWYNQVSFTNYTTSNGLTLNVKSISIDSQNNKWFSGMANVSMFDGTNWYNFGPSDGLPATMITGIAADGQDNIWLSTYTAGVAVISHCNPLMQNVCLVTVDTASGKNKIVWNKIQRTDRTSFNIYKEVSTNTYSVIGNVLYNDPSYFIDMSSNPASHTDKYKITVNDICGFESPKSPYHESMNLVISTNGSTMGLIWTPYVDESGSFVPPKYYIFRGSQPNNLQMFDSLSGSNTSYNDNNVYTSYYYMIGVKKPGGCDNSKSNSGMAFSNRKLNFGSGIDDLNNKIEVSIYPNPANQILHIEIPVEANLTIYDVQGKLISSAKLLNQKSEVDISQLSVGIYTLKIQTVKGIAIRKLIKE